MIVFRLAVISIFEEPQQGSRFAILGGEFFRVTANAWIGMYQEFVEGLSFLSADDAFPGDETLEISQVLPVLQLRSSESGTILAEMARMAGSREFFIRAHPAAAPAIMPMSFTLLGHDYLSLGMEYVIASGRDTGSL